MTAGTEGDADAQGAAGLAIGGGASRTETLALGQAWLWTILPVALTMQYEAQHPHAEHPVIDEASYDGWAREIAAGDWLGDEVFFQEPLYPYGMALLYAVLGPDRTAVRHAQVGLGAIACVLVALLGARIFGRRAGIVAGLALAVYLPALWLPSLLLKENLFLFVLVLLALALLRARRPRAWLGVGVLAALGSLLRGNLLVLLPLFVLWPLVRSRLEQMRGGERSGSALAGAAAVVLGIALVLLPVAFRNQHVGGVFVLSTSGAGTNLYGGNNEQNPYGRATEFDWVRGIPEYEAGDWRREAERRTGRALDPSEVSAYWRDEVWRSMRRDPGLHLSILWNKLRLTLGRYEVPDNHLLPWDARYVGLLRWPLPDFGVLGALGLAGLLAFLLRRARGTAQPAGAWQLLVLASLYAGTVVLTVTSSRIRMPLVPLLAPFAGDFLVRGWDLVRGPRSGLAALRWCGSLLVGVVIVWTPVFDATERAEDLDKRDYNLLVQYIEENRDEEARALCQQLLAAHPQSARLRTSAAELDWREALDKRDRPAEASALVERAEAALAEVARRSEVNPRERHRADSLLGWIRLARGDADGALKAFRRAEAFDDEAPELQLSLVRALIRSGEASTEPGARVALLREARERSLRFEVAAFAEVVGLDEVLLVRSQADLALGRAQLDRGAEGIEKEQARGLITDGLKRLAPLAKHEDDDLRRRARKLAGWTQLYLRNAPSAERHFRAALAVDPTDTEAGLGLAQSLVARAATEEGAEADDARREALRVLDELSAAGASQEVLADLRRRLEEG